ncbi:MAG: alkaline phosphatase family protein [Candidatus Rokubacteria bacterium]|nr:alkaline phosphatase family protein [Candidatus Rokubacteria bacterium]
MRALVISIDGLAGFYWTDPLARMPNLRRLAERGVVSPAMQAVFPTTTWPTHVSLATGVSPVRHGVAANHVLNRATGEAEDFTGDPVYDAADLVRVPTIYDRAHAAGRRCAAIDWPATRNAPSLAFNLPFFKNQRVFETQTSPAVWRELGDLGFPVDRQGEWAELPKRFLKDGMVAELAASVWHRHRPDLMLVHYLCADSHQHLYGPKSPEAYWAIAYIDERIGRLLDALPESALDTDTLVFVVSDHGFLPSTREIRVNVWLRQQGLLDVAAGGRITRGAARLVMNHGAGYVYLDGADRDRLARDLASAVSKIEGVAGAWTETDYAALGIPTAAVNPFVGEIALEAAPGYCFGDAATGGDLHGAPKYRGTHGQRPEHADNLAFFLARGPGIRRGATLPRLTSRDVAPTLARLLGIPMPDVEGRTLVEIFA